MPGQYPNKIQCQKIPSQSTKTGQAFRVTLASAILMSFMSGCMWGQKATVSDIDYCDDIDGIQYYRDHATSITYPCLDTQTAEAVAVSAEPRNLYRQHTDSPRDISLDEAIRLALQNNPVIETSSFGGVGSAAVLSNPNNASSVYDPAIQASAVLFGRRSVESALSEFDATFTSRLVTSRSDMSNGNLNGKGDRTDFTSSISKQFATGATLSLNNDWSYTADPITYNAAGTGPHNPEYYGRIGAEFRQPLLAGSGVEFTRIAGPVSPLGAIRGVSQGVVIGQINETVSAATFKISVRNAIRDIEDSYWALYFAYRTYDTAVVAHKSAQRTWKEANDRVDVGVMKPADGLQAQDQLYQTKAAVETSLNALFKAETEFRRLIGEPLNDGTFLRPSDQPAVVEFIPDWESSIRQALTWRTELQRQKWNIKGLQLQLQAARSLVRPRLDFVAGYDVAGAGDTLLSESSAPLHSAIGSLTNDNINNWNAGLQLTIPVGQRFARTQVRNIELQLTKASAILASQEKNVAHDIATAIQDITATYAAAQTNFKRLKAAAERVDKLEIEEDLGTTTLDLVLRAQTSLADAETAFYQQVVDYNRALMNLHFADGTLLQRRGVYLAEGPWDGEAKCDALLRANARTHAKDAPKLKTEPPSFISYAPAGTVDLRIPSHLKAVPVESNIEPEDDDEPMSNLEVRPLPVIGNTQAAPAEAAAVRVPVPLPPKFTKDNQAAGTPLPPTETSARAVLVDPEPIYDPFKDFERQPPTKTATRRLEDFPENILRR